MDVKPITAAQIKVLKDAVDNFKRGDASAQASVHPAPNITPVNGFGVLQPDVTGVDNVEIVVNSPSMRVNDVLSFYWNGDTSIPRVVIDIIPKSVKVPAALVIAAANKTINVIYSVTDSANPHGVPSEVRTLVVENYTAPVYPKPVITEAVGGVLDVNALTANARMTLAAWPRQAVGQKLWLSVISTPQITLENWNPLTITTLGPQNRVISRDKLKTLTHDSSLTLKLEASFDGSNNRVPFSEQTYTIKQQLDVIAVGISSVTDSKGAEIPNGGTTTDTTVTIHGTVTYS